MRFLKWPELLDLRFADEAGKAVYIAWFLYRLWPLQLLSSFGWEHM